VSQTDPIDDFFGMPVDHEPVLIDRSTLERWSECPWQAWGIAHVLAMDPASFEATSGSEAHDVIAKAVQARIAGASYSELCELLRIEAGNARPDVQPDVCAALKCASVIAGRLCYLASGSERHPDDILCHDGGEGERRGQLAMDWPMEGATYRLTGEVDLLLRTESASELDLDDWKTGNKHWTAGDVASSFQFQFYAELVFRRYPSCQQINARVHMPRLGYSTEPVAFRQKDRTRIRSRIQAALDLYHQHAGKSEASGIPCHPLPERCAWCPCCVPGKCPLVRREAKELPSSPEAMLELLAATEAASKRIAGLLTERVRDTGREIESGKLRFGINKPAAARARKCDLYTLD